MNLLAIVMQLTGIGLILTAIDVFAVPWIRDVLTPSAPEVVPELENHIIICEHTPRTDAFIGELDARDSNYVLIESDPETARGLYERGYRLIEGDAETTETLANAHLESSMCVVIDAADDRSASIALAVRDARPDVRVITLADDTTAVFATLIVRELNPDLRIIVRANEEEDVEKLYRAGADYVQSLATVSGRMLASTVFEDGEVLRYETQVNAVRLPASGLEGTTLAEEEVRTTTGCTVIAVIRNGETITRFDPVKFTFEAGDEVVITGTNEAITQFEQQFRP